MPSKITLIASKINLEILSLIFLFLLSLGLRLYLLYEFPHVVFGHEADAIGYFGIAKSILTIWGLGDTSTHFPPFYPFVIAVASLLSGDIEVAGRVVSSLMGALLVFPVYLISKEIYGKRVGYLSAIVVVFLGEFIDYSLSPVTQATYITLLMTSVYIGIILLERRTFVLFFLLGLTSGALYLTRPEGISLFIYISMIILASLFLDHKSALKEKIKAVSLLFIGFAILALPYMNYLYKQTGKLSLSGKAAAALIGMDGMAKLLPSGETIGSISAGKMGIFDIYSNVGELLEAYWDHLIQYAVLVPQLFPPAYLFAAFLGLITSLISIFLATKDSFKTKAFRFCMILGCIVAVLPVFIFDISKTASYISPVFPLITIWLSKGLLDIEGSIVKFVALTLSYDHEKLRQWSLASTAVILFFSYSSFTPFWKKISSEDFRYFAASQEFFYKDTGTWIKQNTPKDAVVMSRWSNIWFYGDRTGVGLVDGEISEVVKYAREHGVTHIVIDSNAVPRRRPRLEPLLYLSNYEGLRPRYVVEKYGIRVIIYEVL